MIIVTGGAGFIGSSVSATNRQLRRFRHSYDIRRQLVLPGAMAAHGSTATALRKALEPAGIEFIDENGGGPGVRLRKRQQKKKTQEGANSAAHARFRKQRSQSD
jgi:hypothetical protein